MKILRYISHNGIIQTEEQNSIHHTNRAFAYGDSFFETMHANGMTIQFYSIHWQRIKKACEILDYKLPTQFDDFGEGLFKQIIKLLHRNRFFQGVRVRVSFYRNTGGYFYPTEQRLSYIIQLEKLSDSQYVLNKIGYDCDICEGIPHPKLPWSRIKTGNSLVFIQAAKYARKHDLDDCFFVDKNNHLIEGIASNIFIIKNNKIFTPPLSEGCVDGVMRQVILRSAQNIGLSIKEKRLKIDSLLEAEEIWTSNAIQGIRWVKSFRNSRYFHNKASLMVDEINKQNLS